MDQPQEFLTIDEVAFTLKVGVPTVESLINRGLLEMADTPGERRIRRKDLVDLMRRNQQELDHREPDEPAQDFGIMGSRTDE